MIETLNDCQRTGARGYKLPAMVWERADPPVKALGYALDAILAKDEEGSGYVVSIAQLPGVISEGNDFASAIKNVMEAFVAVVETYHAEGMAIPWKEAPPEEPKEERFRIVVPCPSCR